MINFHLSINVSSTLLTHTTWRTEALLLLDCENVYYSPSTPTLLVTKPFPECNELMVDTICPLPRCRCRHSILYPPSIVDMSSPSGTVLYSSSKSLFFFSLQTLLHYLLPTLCKLTDTIFSLHPFFFFLLIGAIYSPPHYVEISP